MEVRATIFRWRIWRFLFTLRGLWNAFDFFGWSLLMLPFPHDTMLEEHEAVHLEKTFFAA